MSQTGIMTRNTVANMASVPCRLCAVLKKETNLPGVDTPWLDKQGYAALVSFGALVPGWTLLCPVEHHTNMQAAYAEQRFWQFASEAQAVVSSRFGRVSVFEHGPSAADSLTGCGTGHAHMHLVPLNFSLSEESAQFDRTRSWIPCLASEIAERVGGCEYLFVADDFKGAQTQGMLCILEESTSQFFRKVIAQRLGMAEFSDYRRYPMLDIVETSSILLATDVLNKQMAVIPQMSCD